MEDENYVLFFTFYIFQDKPRTQEADSWTGKLFYLVSIMTIEPMMFAQGLAGGISSIAQDQMILYKICRGKI